MKRLLTILTLLLFFTGLQAQQKVRMKIDGKEVFVFDSSRLQILNNYGNVIIGDHAGDSLQTPHGNVAIGNYALSQSKIHRENIAIGDSALMLNGKNVIDPNLAISNIAIGAHSMAKNLSGAANVAIGDRTLNANTSGYSNTALGFQAMFSNQTGSHNTAVGEGALRAATNGFNNAALGDDALLNNTGSNNTALGQGAFSGASSGSGNIGLGFQAGANETGSNRLYIENSNSSSPLIYGEFDNDILRINGELHIGSAYKFPNTGGSFGQVLKTDGSGQLSWQDELVEDGDTDPFNELIDSIRFNYPFVEIYQAGDPVPHQVDLYVLGDDGDADPSNELQTLMTSNDSLFISGGNGVKLPGGAAGTMMIDGDGDTKIELLENGATDIIGLTVDNVQILGIDYRSLQFFNNDNNTFVGGSSGALLGSGSGNSFFGKEAGSILTSGSSNTFIGKGSGGSNTSGDNNTYIGFQAGSLTPSASDNIFIGKDAGQFFTGSNKLVIENSNSSAPLIYGDFLGDEVGINGNLGVGVQDPATRFHVKSNSTTAARFESIDNTIVEFYKSGNPKGFIQTLNEDFIFGKAPAAPAGSVQFYNNGHYMTLEDDGDVAIGTNSPVSNKLKVESANTAPIISSTSTFSGSVDVIAVEGTSQPADGYGYGGYFSGGYRGAVGIAEGGSAPFTVTGLYGVANSSNGPTQGLYASATGGTTNWAGYFDNGNVFVKNEIRIGNIDGAVGYSLAVGGKIIGEELRIQFQGDWPDYVFDDEYELMTLEEVEAAIQKNQHLPGIPSATEVSNEGIMVGDMQKRMMEKIEELTLYVIDLQKQIKELKTEVSSN